jgi:hydroxypyruvate isomerase
VSLSGAALSATMLYPDLPFMERFGAAAGDDFTGVEYVAPMIRTLLCGACSTGMD